MRCHRTPSWRLHKSSSVTEIVVTDKWRNKDIGIVICAGTITSSKIPFTEGGSKAPHVFPGVAVGDADTIHIGVVNSGIWFKVVTIERISLAVLVGNDTTAHAAVADTVGWIEH